MGVSQQRPLWRGKFRHGALGLATNFLHLRPHTTTTYLPLQFPLLKSEVCSGVPSQLSPAIKGNGIIGKDRVLRVCTVHRLE